MPEYEITITDCDKLKVTRLTASAADWWRVLMDELKKQASESGFAWENCETKVYSDKDNHQLDITARFGETKTTFHARVRKL